MINTFGEAIDTKTLVDLLFVQNLPKPYETVRLNSIVLDKVLKIAYQTRCIWDDIKQSQNHPLKVTPNF
jgi:hypothetical protein